MTRLDAAAHAGDGHDAVPISPARPDRLRDALVETQRELVAARQETQDLSYHVSHDLGAPVRHVSAFAEMLVKRHGDQLTDDARELLSFVVNGVEEAGAMLDRLREFSRVATRAGGGEEVDCEEAFAVALARRRPGEAVLPIRVNCGPLPRITAHADQVSTLFGELIDNAVKFRNPANDPRLEVSAARVGAEWAFSFRDNGTGLDHEACPRAFGVFQRLHSRRDYPGSGMGLAICRRIVERHGGRIRMESEPGKGATVLFSLPDVAVAAGDAEPHVSQ